MVSRPSPGYENHKIIGITTLFFRGAVGTTMQGGRAANFPTTDTIFSNKLILFNFS